MVKVHLPNRTHQKLTISPTSTIFDTNKLVIYFKKIFYLF